jgi:hypothetical protein
VPVVLIKLSESEKVVQPRPRFGTPALLAVTAQDGRPASMRAFSARPSADLPCAAAKQPHAADARTGWAGLLPIGPATNYMTRILASGEAASGPHPAREPEPV